MVWTGKRGFWLLSLAVVCNPLWSYAQQPKSIMSIVVLEIRRDQSKLPQSERIRVRALLPNESEMREHEIGQQDAIAEGTYIEVPERIEIMLSSPQAPRIALEEKSCYQLRVLNAEVERHWVRCGRVRFEVARRWIKGQLNFFNVESETFVLAVRGTKFSVEVKPREFVRIKRTEGEVVIREIPPNPLEEKSTGLKEVVLNESGEQEYFKPFSPDDFLKRFESYVDAETIYGRRLELARASGKADLVLQALLDLGLILQTLGRPQASISAFEEAAMIAEREGKKQQQIWILNNLGNAHQEQHDARRALAYHEKALKLRSEQHPISFNQDIADSYNNIGNVYYDQGNFARAIEYHKKALEIRSTFMFRRRAIAQSYNNLGEAYRKAGNPGTAVNYHLKALAVRQKLYPDGRHPEVANTHNNLGDAYFDLGETHKALEHQERALAIRRKLFPGGTHPMIAQSLSNVGSALVAQGELERGLTMYENAFMIQAHNYPDGVHPDFVKIYNNFAEVAAEQGDSVTENYFRSKASEVEAALAARD
jgi:tetratricopeptide (TPR) repeat protein